MAAILAMTWVWQMPLSAAEPRRATADAQHTTDVDFDRAAVGSADKVPQSPGSSGESPRAAQANPSATAGQQQQSPEQEVRQTDTLACELTVARRDVGWLQSLEHEHNRAERLEQDLAAARRDLETQTALAVKASDETARMKQDSESGAAELQNSLQKERERAKRLEQALEGARRDVESQTALAARAGDEASKLKESSQTAIAELRQRIQKEHERADALAQDLSMARAKIYAHEAELSNARDAAAEPGQKADRGTAELRNSLQQERDRAERLEQSLAAARREAETQAALAAKAREEAAGVRQTAERESAKLLNALQQEHAKGERLERAVAFAQRNDETPSSPDSTVAPKLATIGQVAQENPVQADADRATAAGTRGDGHPNAEQPVEAARLVARASVLLERGDIGAARIVLERAVDIGSAQASFALAETYDPSVLPKWGTYGTRGDATKARDLYAKADAGGIEEAKARVEALRP